MASNQANAGSSDLAVFDQVDGPSSQDDAIPAETSVDTTAQSGSPESGSTDTHLQVNQSAIPASSGADTVQASATPSVPSAAPSRRTAHATGSSASSIPSLARSAGTSSRASTPIASSSRVTQSPRRSFAPPLPSVSSMMLGTAPAAVNQPPPTTTASAAGPSRSTAPSMTGTGIPSMFGSYSATGSGSSSLAESYAAAAGRADTSVFDSPPPGPTHSAGYWRAPAQASRPSTASAFRPAHPNSNASRTATASRYGWATADPAGWAGNTRSEARKKSGFEENTLLSFSWTVSDLQLLREEVEQTPLPSDEGRSVSAGAGKSEVWTCHPIFGDGKWKLELIRSQRASTPTHQEDVNDSNSPPQQAPASTTVLSAYLTSLVLDYGHPEVAIPAHVMFGIRAPSNTSTCRGFVWTAFIEHTFRPEAEFLECHNLPTLSELLADADIANANAIDLVVQIGTGPQLTERSEASITSPSDGRTTNDHQLTPFQLQEAQVVPTSLVTGLETLIDCAATGDVALIVRERGIVPAPRHLDDSPVDVGFEVSPWPVGQSMPSVPASSDEDDDDPRVVVRDRVIWAHSAILRSRSEYFATMLDSDFAEGQGLEVQGPHRAGGLQAGRRVKVLRIPDSDWYTMLAFVRYLYTANVDYLPAEDIRSVALDEDWMQTEPPHLQSSDGSSDNGRPSGGPVWAWRSLAQIDEDTSQSYNATASRSNHSPAASGSYHEDTPATPTTPRSKSRPHGSIPAPGNIILSALATDPHPHPAQVNCEASALALYRLAHRYAHSSLQWLSQRHLVSSLTPSTSFPILLATHLYPTLHRPIRSFVLQRWSEVGETEEWERCFDEICRGEWGIDAGKTLSGLMRELKSPGEAAGHAEHQQQSQGVHGSGQQTSQGTRRLGAR